MRYPRKTKKALKKLIDNRRLHHKELKRLDKNIHTVILTRIIGDNLYKEAIKVRLTDTHVNDTSRGWVVQGSVSAIMKRA
jgi:hypothetical protein